MNRRCFVTNGVIAAACRKLFSRLFNLVALIYARTTTLSSCEMSVIAEAAMSCGYVNG